MAGRGVVTNSNFFGNMPITNQMSVLSGKMVFRPLVTAGPSKPADCVDLVVEPMSQSRATPTASIPEALTPDDYQFDPTINHAARFSSAGEFIDRFRPRNTKRLFRVAKSDLHELVFQASAVFQKRREVFDDHGIYYGIANNPLTLLDGQRVVERVPKSRFGTRLAKESMISMEDGDEYVEISNPGLILKNGKPYLFYVHEWQFRLSADPHTSRSLWKRSLDKGPDVPPRYIVLEIDGQSATPVDPEIAFFDSKGSQAAYHRNELYQSTGLPYRSVQLWEQETRRKDSSAPRFIATRGHELIDPDTDLSGHVVLNRETGDPESIFYQDQLFTLNERTSCHAGWYYSSNGELGIRFMENDEGTMLIEEMPSDAIRFPEEHPCIIRYDGKLFKVRERSEDGRLLHAGRSAFANDNQGLRRLDPSSYAIAPEKIDSDAWDALPRNEGASFPSIYERVEVFLSEDIVGDDSAPIYEYRQYRLSYGNHDVLLQVPDEAGAEDIAKRIHDLLCGMPHALLMGGRKVTILPRDTLFDRKTVEGRFGAGQIITLHPTLYDNLDGSYELEEVLYHEFAHAFTYEVPDLFYIALRQAAYNAHAIDRSWGYRAYARKNWHEALSVGAQNFHRAGSAMQRLLLNLLTNPECAPEHSRFNP